MNVTEIGLYGKLAAATALTTLLSAATAIYPTQAPQGTSMAYVVYVYAGGGLENQNPSELHNTVYLVKGVAASIAAAGAIQAQIKAALHGATLTVTGYTNFYMACEGEVQLDEVLRDGSLVSQRGWYVRIRLDN